MAYSSPINLSPTKLSKVAILGSYSPRKCGIATFSADVASSLEAAQPGFQVDAIAMSDRDDYNYPDQVHIEIPDQNREAYAEAAQKINAGGYDVLSVQHEYGIFGGVAGEYLLDLVRAVKIPIVVTLHTVLEKPSDDQKRVLDELIQLAERVIVMSQKAVDFLTSAYQVAPEKVELIHHGIPTIKEGDGIAIRARLGIKGPMILTFGLLSPDKGIQYMIGAMPKILAKYPNAVYVIVGATHPNIKISSGEVYRESLIKMAKDLDITENVVFVDRFVDIDELVEYLGAMDIYVTPYLNQKQITSGTLAYSLGSGKPVISTPYWYAEELLAEGRGVLVPFKESEALADAVIQMEDNPEFRAEIKQKTTEFTRQMLWPAVAASYLRTFECAWAESRDRLKAIAKQPDIKPQRSIKLSPAKFPKLQLDHLKVLTDDTGILQHATFNIPNRAEGYCVDDNARALLFTANLELESPLTPDLSLLQSRYLSFVLDAYNPANGKFRNFMSFDRQWLEEAGSEDSQGRSLWSLGVMVHRTRDQGRRELAKLLFFASQESLLQSTSLRTWAYAALAAEEFLCAYPAEPKARKLLEEMAGRLHHHFELNYSPDWPWCEDRLTYANARLPQALLVAGHAMQNKPMVEMGLESLSWLMTIQRDSQGHFAPIGSNGFFAKGKNRSYYDQQPVEAAAAIATCLSAYRITRDSEWKHEANRAFAWFLGENSLGQSVCDPESGGCHDGIHPDRLNRNQGAESTLSYLCALVDIRQSDPTLAKRIVTAEIL